MVEILALESWIGLLVSFGLLAIKIFAFTSALLYSAESYLAADKLNKPTWCIILAVAVGLQFLNFLGAGLLTIVNIAATVAALVYLVDVRPALAGLRRR